MQTFRIGCLLALVLSCGFLAACPNRELDRATAERLIRDNGQLGSPLTLRLRSPAFVDNPPGMYGSAAGRSTDKSKWTLLLIDTLGEAGIVQILQDQQHPMGNGGAMGILTDRPFRAIPQDSVTSNGDFVILTLATPRLMAVTGISQHETEAEAEANVGLNPTALFTRLQPLLAPYLPMCSSFTEPKPGGCSWPTEKTIASSTEKARFRFKRYDDGWRLES